MKSNFFKKWGEGIKNIPQEQLLYSEMLGLGGSIIGTIAACLFFIFYMKLFWILAIPLGFSIIMQTSQFLAKFQQYKMVKEFQNKLKEVNMS